MIFGKATLATDDAIDEEVTDTEWFFLVSMTKSFINGGGLLSQAFFNTSPIWVTGANRLVSSPCDRAQQGQVFGLQTMVCITKPPATSSKRGVLHQRIEISVVFLIGVDGFVGLIGAVVVDGLMGLGSVMG